MTRTPAGSACNARSARRTPRWACALLVVHGKAAADIQYALRVPQPCGARIKSRHTGDGFARASPGRPPATRRERTVPSIRCANSPPAATARDRLRVRSRTCATNRRRASGLRNDTRISSAARCRYLTNLRSSSGLSTTNRFTPKSNAVRMSPSRLIGWVWMQRSGRHPSGAPIDLAVGGKVKAGALRRAACRSPRRAAAASGRSAERRRAARRRAAILPADALRIDDEQRRAVALDQVLDRFTREWIRGRIELQCVDASGTRAELVLGTSSRSIRANRRPMPLARCRRSRIAAQRSSSGRLCTKILAQPARSRVRR
jgi:hypothetical protein